MLLLLLILSGARAQECIKKDYGNGGHVCVCTSSHCDAVPQPVPLAPPNYLVYTSNKKGLRFFKTQGTFMETNQIFDNQIYVNKNEQYQQILGWGGAFTDAFGINLNSLPNQTRDFLLESYFSKSGIEYSLCRVPIGGTDFSTRGYSYNDGKADPALQNFKLAKEDFAYKVPFVKKAQSLSNGTIRFFASAWTAPTWMKTNGKYSGLGFLKEEMYQAWANYHVKFLEEYHKLGIDFWGLTTGNEPSLGLIPFGKINSVGWAPTNMANWVKNNLGPVIKKSNFSDIKLMILDDQRFFLPWFVNIALKDNSTRKYVDGIAVHWYYDTLFPATLLTDTRANFPEMFLLGTEACHGDKPGQKHVVLGSWQRGESYADDIIQDLQNWVGGWVDWNLALDLNGGPTYIKNYVDSAIIVNATSGEFYKQPMFYNLGHFSKFVPKGSRRIASKNFDEKVPFVAFRRPDNGTVVVILNKKEEIVPVALIDDQRGTARVHLSEKSITTILYW